MSYVSNQFGSAYSPAAFHQMTTGSPEFDWNGMLGPVSKGLNIFGGIADAVNMFGAAGAQKGSAKQLRLQAGQALEQGFQTGMDVYGEGQEVLGEMTAAFGKSGSLLEGSPLLVLADTTRKIERDIMRSIQQGRIQQQALLVQARQAEKAAQGAILGGIVKVAGVVAAPFTGGASLALTAAAWG